jgi:hypothetical protein
MKRHRKYHLPIPPKMEGIPSPAEIIEAFGNARSTVGNPVELISVGPPVEIIEAFPKPKLDPNRTLAPTETEVNYLPYWAKIAFAARCARRLLPLLNTDLIELSADQQLTAATIVRAVEQSAATASFAPRKTVTKKTIQAVEDLIENGVLSGDCKDAVRAALAAASLEACKTAQITVAALQRLATVRTLRFVLLPRRDFDQIFRLAKEGNWTNDSPVSQDVFGPMWDREPPSWWRDYRDLPTLEMPDSL